VLTIVLLTSGAIAQPAVAEEVPAAPTGLVLINELASGGAGSDAESFFELRNWGETAVDLTGWQVFRCSAQGLRSNVGRAEGDLTGIVLEPGEIVTVSKVGMSGDTHITSPFMTSGFGLYLEDADDRLMDAIGVYPNEPWPTTSECTVGDNLPNTLAFAFDESWQRVAATGEPLRDFVVAPRTVAEQNVTAAPEQSASPVIVGEFAPSGPAAKDDEFVELWNLGATTVEVGGFELYRCTGTGRLRGNTLQATIPAGTTIAAGERYVLAGGGFTGEADQRYGGGFADVASGVYLRSSEGLLVDRVAVSAYGDSACQGTKLPATLDHVDAQSWQFTPKGWVAAKRTPGAANASSTVAPEEFAFGSVAISEFASDPSTTGATQHNYVELGNYGEETVDIGGWTIRRCEASGIRSREVQLEIPDGTDLEPGATFLAAREGTSVAADATYPVSFNFLGSGAWLADERGKRVDSVGMFAMNEMDQSLVTYSPCTKGATLTTFQPDRVAGETFQRSRFTGVDADDFVTALATPGEIDEHEWIDPTARVEGTTVDVAAPTTVLQPALPPTATAVTVLEAWAGVSDAPLESEVGPAETALDPAAPGAIADAAFAYPYQRLVLDASGLEVGSRVYWEGTTSGRNELQLSVWDGDDWRLMDAGTGGTVRLEGVVEWGDMHEDRLLILVQDGPRTEATLAPGIDGQLQDPADYDFAISHITDTQYLSEAHPGVYAELASWIADNAEQRDIAFATHTGDLIQNWVDPNQGLDRATREFETASAVQQILDDAGVPNSVLPGNHDNKRGVSNDLFNEYFGPERYAGEDWYGDSIAPDDNSANFSTFERDGAQFLMLSLPYAYGPEEVTWAEGVVASHPSHNVVISTHENVKPKTLLEDAHRSTNSRWVSNAQDLWDRVIAPHRNVVVVLSGHFHGLGQIVTENAGGLEGHTVVELLADYQEFRTHSGQRATGFQRLLQVDLAGSTIAVDTFSATLGATYSHSYDYGQFLPDNGTDGSFSTARPWNIVAAGTVDRYGEPDDEFAAHVTFQYPKSVATSAVLAAPPLPEPEGSSSTAAGSLSDMFRISV